MEETILSPTLANKVYNLRSMRIAIFIGGPLVVGYLMAANFKNLGQEDKVGKTWLYSILGLIGFLLLAAVVPENVPAVAFGLANYAVASYFIQKYQAPHIEAHIESGGRTYKTYRGVLVGLISTAILIAIILGCFLAADAMGMLE